MIAFTLLLVYVFVLFAALRIQVDIIHDDPAEMPGGGWWVVVARAALWPLIVVLALVVLVVMGVEVLLGGPR